MWPVHKDKIPQEIGALDHRVRFEMIVIPLGTHHAEAEAMLAHTIL